MPPSTKKTAAKKTAAKKTTRTRPTVAEAAENPLSTPIGVVDPAGADAKYAATSWATGATGDPSGPQDLEVPSGQMCLVRRVGVEGLMTAGVLHNVDRLSAIVNDKHLTKKGKGSKPEQVDVGRLLKDPSKLTEIMHTVDRVVCYVVLKPEIQMAPNDVTLRKDHVIYTDQVDLIDKMFIFNFVVGGSRDLESFRGGLADAVGGLDAGEDVPLFAQ